MSTNAASEQTESPARREARKQERKSKARWADPDRPSPQEGSTADDEDPEPTP